MVLGSRPRLRRQAGQRPAGASGESGALHSGQVGMGSLFAEKLFAMEATSLMKGY